MKALPLKRLLLASCLLGLFGCGVRPQTAHLAQRNDPTLGYGVSSSAKALVYKTRSDCYDRVPVLMDAGKTTILSYPDPTDVQLGAGLTLPTRLKNGYLLDNRGIGPNVAFLTYTYQAYSKLPSAPSMRQLMDSLLDTNPLTELWDCGSRSRFKNETEELNALIDKGFPQQKALR